MAVVGGPSQRQRDTYSRFLEVHQRTLDAVRPGISGADLHEAAARAYRDQGVPVRAMCGHNIGLVLHERPIVTDHEQWTVGEGMVMCIENGTAIAGYDERCSIEDTLVVTSTGAEILSTFSDTSEMTTIE